jgi:ABC-type branched-subunit amino acid transport system substrate-binding protein
LFWIIANWVAHDINKRGGILVDGKRKKIQLIQGDTQGKPAIAKVVAERLCLEEKIHVLWGTDGSHNALAIQLVAGKYKVIFANCGAYSDELMNGQNFNRYTFRTGWTTTMIGHAMAYFLSQRPERRFYILCQDYLFGHNLAEAFKKGLKKYKPNADIVGEAYHPLWTKDFAPYLTKIKGSGAEVIFTGDWGQDGSNLIKQARELGVKLPIAHVLIDQPNALYAVGPAGTLGLLNVNEFLMDDDLPEHRAWLHNWNRQWNRWKKPYNTPWYKWPFCSTGAYLSQTYWLMDVIQRAGSTDPERIIQTWEGDEWNSISGPLKMRACDHQAILDLFATEYVYPNKWFEGCAYTGKIIKIPARYVTPPVPEDLARCRK